MPRHSRLRKVVFLNSLAPILVIVPILLIALRLQQDVLTAQSWVTHTLKVETEIQGILNSLLSAQSSLRAFVLTRNSRDLTAYQSYASALPGDLQVLRSDVRGNQSQSERAEKITQLADRRIKLLEKVAALPGIDPPELIAEGRGLMDRIRPEAQAMLLTEEQRLAQRTKDLQNIRAIFTAALWTALIAAFICGSLEYRYSHIYLIRRLEALTHDVEFYGSKDQTIPLSDTAPDELGALRRVFSQTGNRLSQERKRIIETLYALQLQTDRAEAALHSKTDFLACMSHEIRTPMTGVIGLVDLSLASDDLPPHHRSSLEEVQKSSRVLLSLMNDILDLSKIEAGKMQLEIVSCNLAELVCSASEVFRIQAKQKTVSVEIEIQPELPVLVLIDPTRFRQILGNLLSNSVKFTDHGFIRISVRRSSVSANSIEFSVHDTGIGIAPEFRQQLFQPFSQADLSTTRAFGGTGLGLSIVMRLIQLMNGTISVESQLGLGSRFVFTLPLKANQEVPASSAVDGSPNNLLPNPALETDCLFSVLFAEDNSINRLLVKTILTNVGFDVTLVNNGEDAVATARRQKFDLILMDCRMPKMDGYAATRVIRAFPDERGKVPIIALTANAFQKDKDLCINCGMDDFISKPFESDALIQKCLFWIRARSEEMQTTHPLQKAQTAG